MGHLREAFIENIVFFIIAKYIFRKKIIYHIHGSEYHLFYLNSKSFIKKKIEKMVNSVEGLIVLSKEWKSFF